MRILLPVSFWTFLVIELGDYSDAFTPPNLQNIFRTARSPSVGIIKDDDTNYHNYINDSQRLWATTTTTTKDDSPTPDDTSQIRAAYMQWCEKYQKPTDRSRYPQFVNNYKVMESIARKGGKAMHLNEYADFTGEEFQIMMNEKEQQVPKRVIEKAQIQRSESIGREESFGPTRTLVQAAKLMVTERQQQERDNRNTEPQSQPQQQKVQQDPIPSQTKDNDSENATTTTPSTSTKTTTKLIDNSAVPKDQLQSTATPPPPPAKSVSLSNDDDKSKSTNDGIVKPRAADGNLKTNDKKKDVVETKNIASSASTGNKKTEVESGRQKNDQTESKPTDISSSSTQQLTAPGNSSKKDRPVENNSSSVTTLSLIHI